MMSKKILVIGLDGGTWTVLKPAMEEGYMPHLAELTAEGASGVLESTMPAITPAAWGSFQTGVNPGKNGVYDFFYWDKQERRRVPVSSASLQKTVWEVASEFDKKVAVVNVPMTYPPREVNGYVVSGLLTPSLESSFTYPPNLKPELLDLAPDYHIFSLGDVGELRPHQEYVQFIERMITNITNRAKVAKHIMSKTSFDLFMVHFQATDVLQHALWGYLDPSHSLYDGDKRNEILDRFFGKIDKEIQGVRRAFEKSVGCNYTTFIISDHGFQAHKKRFNLGNWLYQQGYLDLDTTDASLAMRMIRLADVFDIRKCLPSGLRSKVSRKLRGIEKESHGFRWETTQAFSVGRSNEGFIYLLEEQSQQRENTINTLTQKLQGIQDPETGASIVQKVHRREEIFRGDLRLMPDLVIEPADGYSFTGNYQPDEGLLHEVNPHTDFHIGKHHRDGILVANGKGIHTRSQIHARIIDVVPTLLYYLGLPLREGIDGQAIPGLFSKGFDSDSLQSDQQAADKTEKESDVRYSREDERAIKNRLEDLGYL